MPSLALIAVIIIVAAFGFIFYRSVTGVRKLQARKKETRLSLGFQPLENPDPALVSRLVSLHQKRPRQKLVIKDLHLRRESNYQIYLYELWNHSGNDSDLKEEWALAVTSPYLNLPRFTLIPRIDLPGKLAGLANRFLQKLAVKDTVKVDFDSHTAFSQRYMVTGENADSIRRLFTARLLNRLSDTSFWMVEGSSDLLTFSKLEFNQKSKPQADQLSERLQEIRQLFQLFSEDVRK